MDGKFCQVFGSGKKFFLLVTLCCSLICMAEVPQGALPGLFMVGRTKIDKQYDTAFVYVSQGNLQYQASTDTWRFAEQQYDTLGAKNLKISIDNSDWIDLFGWGTSGEAGTKPYAYSLSDTYAAVGGSIAETQYDWGLKNPISNGGNKPGMWRTLTDEEWKFLMLENAHYHANVAGVNGLIILPAYFEDPEVVSWPEVTNSYSDLSITTVQWQKLQNAGCLFLPASGNRASNTFIADVNVYGYYWSASSSASSASCEVVNEGALTHVGVNYPLPPYVGCAVRLVQNYVKPVVKEHNLYVNGVKVTDGNASDILKDGCLSFDKAANTLVMNNSQDKIKQIVFEAEDPVVQIEGTNTIYANTDVVLTFEGKLTVRGGGNLLVVGKKAFVSSDVELQDGLELWGNTTFTDNSVYMAKVEQQSFIGKGLFSVADNRKIRFTTGNLWELVGLDVFCLADQPYSQPAECVYLDYPHWLDYGLITWTDRTVKAFETGIRNVSGDISQWDLLTNAEWSYILKKRANGLYLYGPACVEGVNGLVILPDGWEQPVELPSFLSMGVADNPAYTDNVYNAVQWKTMENAGAVFLPTTYGGNYGGQYLSKTEEDGNFRFLDFTCNNYRQESYAEQDYNTHKTQGALRFVVRQESTGLERLNVKDDCQNGKFMQNGRLIILHDGVFYDACGIKVE